MPEMFESLMFAAQREIVITTPYYVPDEALQNALCTTAYRGVDTTIIFPARNDSWIVGAASRSYYADLLTAGVKIYEYQGGLADLTPAVEQPHCHTRARALTSLGSRAE